MVRAAAAIAEGLGFNSRAGKLFHICGLAWTVGEASMTHITNIIDGAVGMPKPWEGLGKGGIGTDLVVKIHTTSGAPPHRSALPERATDRGLRQKVVQTV